MSGLAKISFTGESAASPVSFVSWIGRPQLPVQTLEYTTRLGGSQLIISALKKESIPTNVTAVIAATNSAYSVASALRDINEALESLQNNLGKRCTWTDENGLTIERVYIMNLSYNIKVVDGGAKAIANVQMTVMVDEAPVQSSGANGYYSSSFDSYLKGK